MEVFVAQNLVFDSPRVPKARLLANVVEDFRILRENHLHQELLREGECFDRSLSDVHKLGFRVAHKVVVAKEARGIELVRDLERFLLERLLVGVEADADCTIRYEVHLKYLVFLVIDDIFVLIFAELTWLKAKGNIIEELAVLVFLRIEKESEVVENVIK